MVDALISAVCGTAGGVLGVGLLHAVRMVGNPLRYRRTPPPLDLSRYRLPEE